MSAGRIAVTLPIVAVIPPQSFQSLQKNSTSVCASVLALRMGYTGATEGRVMKNSIAMSVLVLSAAVFTAAQNRSDIEPNDTMVSPESITSTRDGTVIFGSTGKGTIYRATPGAARAEAWILPGNTGLINTLGVFADERANTLWVCSTAT